jgi:hypothetical protein
LCLRVAERVAAVTEAARARARAAGARLVMAVVLFGLVAGAPALVYRLRFGVWLDGS